MGKTAIVIGASMGGLTTAAVLAEHFSRVIVIERDQLPDGAEVRSGVPQGGRVHNLLSRGDETLGRLFPSLFAQLQAKGAQRVDWSADVAWHHHGVWKTRAKSGVESWFMTRPLLEACVRADLCQRRNVELRQGVEISAYHFAPDHARVTGVALADGTHMAADLVVDCSGRNSKLAEGLVGAGYGTPKMQKIAVDVVYATCLMRPETEPDCRALVQIAPPPGKRSGVSFAVEDGLWMVTMFGYHGDHPPRDPEGWRAFAASLDQPNLSALIQSAHQVTDIRKFHFRQSRWKRFDKMAKLPARLVHLGDAVCSFNPIYGQGMTSATLQAETLGTLIAQHGLDDLHARAPRLLAGIINECWQAAASEDFRFAETTGDAMPAANLVNWYTRRVHRLSSHNADVERRFLKVMHMEAGFTSLFHPSVLGPALFKPV